MNDQHLAPSSPGLARHDGSCHCGAVRFRVELDLQAGGSSCNCSICTKTAMFGSVVKPNAFQLVAGEDSLSSYEWGAKVSRRFFCKHCGVQCFGSGHLDVLGGDFVSVNLNTLDEVDPHTLKRVHWDGRHDDWQVGPRDTPWPVRRDGEARLGS